MIREWLSALSKIPAKGPGLFIKQGPDKSSFNIAFFKQQSKQGQLLVYGGNMKAVEGKGVYDDEDDEFVELINKFVRK